MRRAPGIPGAHYLYCGEAFDSKRAVGQSKASKTVEGMMSITKRALFAFASLAGMPFVAGSIAEAEVVPAKIVRSPDSNVAMRQPFMVGTSECSVIWRDPPNCSPEWSMNSRDPGGPWYNDGPLNESGRALLVHHFGLEHAPKERVTTESLRETSPYHLVLLRRSLEKKHGLPHREIGVSTCIGHQFSADQCI